MKRAWDALHIVDMLVRMLAHVHAPDMTDFAVVAREYKDAALRNANWMLECDELLSGTTTIKTL